MPLSERIEKRFLSLEKLLTLQDEDDRKREKACRCIRKKRRKG
jgi:hypothetical protein